MSERQMLIDQLVKHEGLRLRPYVDTVGKMTVGVGRNLTDKGISSREAFDLLDHDLDECEADLTGAFPWFITLDGVRQIAITDLRFNLGPTRFRLFRELIGAMAAGDFVMAAEQLIRSKWATQVQPDRRDRLYRQLATGDDAVR